MQWGYDFNHESNYTKALVDSVAGFWINEYKMDGFRYDFTKGFSNTKHTGWANAYDAARITILKRMADEVKKRDANAYIIFEHLADISEERQLANAGIMLWRNANDAYCESGMGWSEKSGFEHVYADGSSNGMPRNSLIGYMESHDEERVAFKAKTYGDTSIKALLGTRMSQLGVNAAFFLTVPGPKMIWQFGEFGYDISIDENGRTGEQPVLWSYATAPSRKPLYDTYSNILALRHSYPDLFSSKATFSWELSSTNWTNVRFISCYH